MLLDTRNIVQGDTRRFVIDYRDFLTKGYILATATATLTPGATSTVGAVTLDETFTQVYMYITGGTALNEIFTASLQVTDTDGQTVNDTINFTVVAPGALSS